LAEISEQVGWELQDVQVVRRLRSSAQLWKHEDRKKKVPELRESIVILKFPGSRRLPAERPALSDRLGAMLGILSPGTIHTYRQRSQDAIRIYRTGACLAPQFYGFAHAVNVVRPIALRLHIDRARFAKGGRLGITLRMCMSGLRAVGGRRIAADALLVVKTLLEFRAAYGMRP